MQALEDVFYRGGFFENNKKKIRKKTPPDLTSNFVDINSKINSFY